MYDHTTRAVITGDIIESTKIDGDFVEVLHRITGDIQANQDASFMLQIYRGDNFQSISAQPEKALLLLLIVKAGLKRHSGKRGSKQKQWDARMSVGIGTLEDYPLNNDLQPISGEPFTLSGRTFDHMKEKDQKIALTSGIESLNDELTAVTPLIAALANKWTVAQAEAVYYYLLIDELTQSEIGQRIGQQQRMVSKRLIASEIEALLPYLDRFEKLVKWTYKI